MWTAGSRCGWSRRLARTLRRAERPRRIYGSGFNWRRSWRARVQTVRAASAFSSPMPVPTTMSIQPDCTQMVTTATAMMARFARASLRAESHAAVARLPGWCRWRTRRKAQDRLTSSAPTAARESGRDGIHDLHHRGPDGCERRDQDHERERAAGVGASTGRPGCCEEDQQVDTGVLEEVDTVGEE